MSVWREVGDDPGVGSGAPPEWCVIPGAGSGAPFLVPGSIQAYSAVLDAGAGPRIDVGGNPGAGSGAPLPAMQVARRRHAGGACCGQRRRRGCSRHAGVMQVGRAVANSGTAGAAACSRHAVGARRWHAGGHAGGRQVGRSVANAAAGGAAACRRHAGGACRWHGGTQVGQRPGSAKIVFQNSTKFD